jgi:PPK2 family polyphosphate:nucleotide phosphotransferase
VPRKQDPSSLREVLRVEPGGGGPFDLGEVDPASTPGLPAGKTVSRDPKAWVLSQVPVLEEQLSGLQERLAAATKGGGDPRRLLVVLQAMDCGGKDGTVKHVVGMMNPAGVRIASFGVPTAEERRHHYLWRIRRALPQAGQVGVFNRSHYEDVLVVRVKSLVAPEVWTKRYDEINRFEARLSGSGLRLVKVMLHISGQEQGERLLARLDDPTKRWKYNPSDLDTRAHWADYQAAYGDALARCSTSVAPWYVVPADRKWYRNWAVSRLLVETLTEMDPRYPDSSWDIATERARVVADIAASD